MLGYYESYNAKNKNDSNFQDLLKKHNIQNGIAFLYSDTDDFLLKNYNVKFNTLKLTDDIKVVVLDKKYIVFTSIKSMDVSFICEVLLSIENAYFTDIVQ